MSLWQAFIEALEWVIMALIVLFWLVFVILLAMACWKLGLAYYKGNL